MNMIREIAYSSREEWLKIRAGFIGGSDAGAVVGMNPFKTPYALWAEKTGAVPPFEGNVTTKVGAYLEDLVAKMFEEETGKKVRRVNRVLVNDAYPFACADIDRRVVGENAILEIKTTNSIPVMRKVRGGEYPEAWYCQMVHYLAVTGAERAYLAVLVNCREFKVYVLERDAGEIDALMRSEEAFWELVKQGKPPEADGLAPTSSAISEMYPDAGDGEVDLHPFDTDMESYLAIVRQIKELEVLRDACGNRIKLYMQEACRGASDRFAVTWSNTVRSSFDAKKYQEDHPDIDLSGYFRSSKSRIFKVKEIRS